ncbi:tigger transposable element-derived protein 6 [Plakobranchus ocellatus]|uniref:Tigger transposable element-derived protein 6 n=1 Tax=Plakobranchus ocellatus TaxID=259542 RepID=A0AAV3YFS1_9GAST|nr:tigger transposable element-derived protein 6 [Plakobranchus ocellatus]
MECNSQLSIRQPEVVSVARESALSRHNVITFLKNHEIVYRKIKVTSPNVYNLDEIGMTTIHNPPKVLPQKELKQVRKVISQERGELVTLLGIVFADGTYVLSVLIFPRKKENTFHERHFTRYTRAYHESAYGWINGDLSSKHSGALQSNLVLICGNRENLLSLSVLTYTKAHQVHVIMLPSRTSHKTEPLNKTVFGPLKTYFNAACV